VDRLGSWKVSIPTHSRSSWLSLQYVCPVVVYSDDLEELGKHAEEELRDVIKLREAI
jgi:hypothetical protein